MNSRIDHPFTPSKYQRDIFEFIKNGEGHGIIKAVAGSGKTSSLVEALKYTEGHSVLMCAFNKAMERELSNRVPVHVHTATLHSIGFSILRANNTEIRYDVYDRKVSDMLKILVPTWSERKQYGHHLKRIVSLCKNLLWPGTRKDIERIACRYGIIPPVSVGETTRIVSRCMDQSLEPSTSIDFDDMIYLAAYWLRDNQWFVPRRYDFVFIDEAQDINPAQMEIIRHLLTEKDSRHDAGRLIAVGDSNQAVYGFRGAGIDSMNKIQAEFNATSLPLSVSYRCPRSHVELAQTLVPAIQHAPKAKTGCVMEISAEEMINMARSGDLILSRKNAPLVKIAIQFIIKDRKVVVRGRDIGRGLVGLIDQMDAVSIPQLERRIMTYANNEIIRLLNNEQESQAQALQDRIHCVQALMRDMATVPDLKARIQNLFLDDKKGVVLSSVHKAKGLETRRVFIYDHTGMPMNWKNQQQWERQQERNIKYVALTRSSSDLCLVKESPYY